MLNNYCEWSIWCNPNANLIVISQNNYCGYNENGFNGDRTVFQWSIIEFDELALLLFGIHLVSWLIFILEKQLLKNWRVEEQRFIIKTLGG